jgi:hypothetical protein
LGIEIKITFTRGYFWHEDIASSLTVAIVAAILERACREWLEKQGIIFQSGNDFWCFGREGDYQMTMGNSFDAAQIAALEYCLKERTTQCTDN